MPKHHSDQNVFGLQDANHGDMFISSPPSHDCNLEGGGRGRDVMLPGGEGGVVRVEAILDGTGQEGVGDDDVPVIVVVVIVVNVPPFHCRRRRVPGDANRRRRRQRPETSRDVDASASAPPGRRRRGRRRKVPCTEHMRTPANFYPTISREQVHNAFNYVRAR